MNTLATEQNSPLLAIASNYSRLFVSQSLATEIPSFWQQNATYSVALATAEVSLFKLAGADVAGYLQRRTSNDVLALAVGQGQANTFLDKKAYVQAVFSLHRVDETVFYALVPTVLATKFLEEVNRFKIMEQFTCVDETVQWQVIAQFGITSTGLSEKKANHIDPTTSGGYQITAPFWVFGSQGLLLNATVSLVPNNQPVQVSEKTTPLDLTTFKALQCLWGVPHWGRDLTHETQLPETGLEHDTVSYTKGCFLGQETVARVRTYGGIQQTLMGVKITPKNLIESKFATFLSTSPQSPWYLFHEEKRMAEITSGVLDESTQTLYGLAYLNRSFRLPGVQAQSFILKNGENQEITVSLEIILLPFAEGFPSDTKTTENDQSPSQHQQAQRLHEVAMSHFVENRTEEALLVLNQLLENYPNFLEAYETKGVLLSRLSRFEEAIATMHQLLEKNDKHVMAYTNLSIFWLKLNDKDQAEHYKAKATSVAMGLKMSEAMAKKAALQKTTAAPATSVSVETEVEALAQHQKKLEEKIALFQHALQFAPTDSLAYYGLGTTYLELHQLEAAAAAFEKAVTLNPKHSQGYLQWAETLFALQQYQAVADVLTKGIPVASTRGDLQPLAQMKTLQEKTSPFL
ncbi:MAG: tetratricopeptide repeat protein [Vampirovibrio sp.]|nr:tetratricopeptide repeat protein [Vampirovibrio sp.]